MKVGKCQQCGATYTGDRQQRYCSNACSLKGRGAEWFLEHQRRITAIRKVNGYSRFVQRMRAVGLTDAQIAAVRKEIERARANAHTSGKRLGWAEALGER